MRARAAVFAAAFAMSATGVLMAPAAATDVLCFGEPVTIMGTDGDDVLRGSAGVRDVIYGGAGNDRTRTGLGRHGDRRAGSDVRWAR